MRGSGCGTSLASGKWVCHYPLKQTGHVLSVYCEGNSEVGVSVPALETQVAPVPNVQEQVQKLLQDIMSQTLSSKVRGQRSSGPI